MKRNPSARELHSDLVVFWRSEGQRLRLLNPNFSLEGENLSWNGYQAHQVFDTYDEYFTWLHEERQYSLVYADGSLFQAFFEGSRKNGVVKGSLSYAPVPGTGREYVRFDLDHTAVRDFVHTSYHVHFGYHTVDEQFRLCVKHFPWPSEFLKFVDFLCTGEQCVGFDRKKLFPRDLVALKEAFNHSLDFRVL